MATEVTKAAERLAGAVMLPSDQLLAAVCFGNIEAVEQLLDNDVAFPPDRVRSSNSSVSSIL